MKIADISIRRPSLVIVIFTALTLFGLISYSSLNYELIPKFTPGVISITTVYPGAAPGEVENTVTKKIEDAISSMEKVKKVDAISFESVSLVTITLTDKANVDLSLNDAQRKINAIISDLPDDVKEPSLNKFSLDDLPIMTIAATSNMDAASFYDMMDKRIQPALARVNGVAQVNLVGGSEREIQINIDPLKLEGYNLTILQVQQALMTSNLDFPTGSVKSRETDVLIRLAGKFKNLEEIRDLVISRTTDGGQVRLKDVADVQDSQKDAEKIARVNQKSAIAVEIIKQSDANAVQVSADVRKLLTQVEEDYKAYNIQLDVANDSSTYTMESANAVVFDLFLAIALVAIIMMLFLHSFRNAVIVMIAIPISLIATFIGMAWMGFSLNLMSLLALSLVVGILVDDAIVVIENIYRHMEMGKNKVRASLDGTKEIGFTVVSITAVIVVVFLPIALSTGMVVNVLREFCLTIVIAVIFSLFTSFTVVPLLTSRFGKLEHASNKTLWGRFVLWFEKQIKNFTNFIGGILEWSLNHKFVTLTIVMVLLVSSFMLVPYKFISSEFFPQSDRGEFLLQIEMPKDASLEQTNQMMMQAEQFLASKPEVKTMITTVGQSSDGMVSTTATAYKGEIKVQLVDKKDRADDGVIFAAKLKNALSEELIGAKIKTAQIGALGTAENAQIEMIVIGSNLDTVYNYATQVMDVLRDIPGTAEVRLSVESGNPEVTVTVDRDKMASLGLNMGTVGQTMQLAFNGNTDNSYRQGEYEYDINVRFHDFSRKSIDDVSNITFMNNMGQLIRLTQFAEVKEGSGPTQLERRDKNVAVKVRSQAIGRADSDIIAEWEDKIDSIQKPLGVSYIWGGNMENQQEGFGTLGIALLVSILLVYFIMVALYDSFVHPLVVLFSLPLAIIGALLGLALSNSSLNIFTILGMIMLIGLVAKNAIILVDFTNQLRAEGKSVRESLLLANRARLRPILMTTIAMVIGMLPIALASGAGAEWKNGLAWVIIGGLLSSLFLTLIVVPVIYLLFENILDKLGMNKPKLPIDELLNEDYDHKEVLEY